MQYTETMKIKPLTEIKIQQQQKLKQIRESRTTLLIIRPVNATS